MALQAQITDFLDFQKLGIIGVLGAVIYFMYSFFKTQVADLRIEVLALKAENKELRKQIEEKMIEMQNNILDFMNNKRPQKRKEI
jgi:cobalamin biosynthesis protein CbiD